MRQGEGKIHELLKGTRITWLGHATVLIQIRKGHQYPELILSSHKTRSIEGLCSFRRRSDMFADHGHGDHISDAFPLPQNTDRRSLRFTSYRVYRRQRGLHTMGMNLGRHSATQGCGSNHGRGDAFRRCARRTRNALRWKSLAGFRPRD